MISEPIKQSCGTPRLTTNSVSLYVPCNNAERYIAACLEGVLAQTLRPAEILVVDDGSRDRTVEIAARYPVKILQHEQNRGLAAARNTGFGNSQHELVAALDADCAPASDWLERLAAHLGDPRIAAAGGMLVEQCQETVADRWRATHVAQHWGEKTLRNPSFMFGNNILLRKCAVAQAGWYDEALRTNGEDVNMSARLLALGHETIYDPCALVAHLRRDSIGSILETYWRYRRDYCNRMTLGKVLRNFRYQHFGSARDVLWQDCRNKKVELLGMDALMFVYLPFCDLRQWRREGTAAAPKPQSSEVSG